MTIATDINADYTYLKSIQGLRVRFLNCDDLEGIAKTEKIIKDTQYSIKLSLALKFGY